jgi:fibronectin type 3 domain-containing protein
MRRSLSILLSLAMIWSLLGLSLHQATADSGDQTPLPENTYRFDWGTPDGPVAEGHIPVSENTVYTEGTGYGFTTTADSRMRTAPADDPLRVDFVLLDNDEFVVDVPNGQYKVRLIAGDGTNGQTATGSIQGISFGDIKTNKGEFKEHISIAEVSDGKLRLTFVKGRVNALYITPMVSKPEGLTSVVDSVYGAPAIKLDWHAVNGAAGYHVYKKQEGEAEFAGTGTATGPTFADTSAVPGTAYVYHVRAFNYDGDESEASDTTTIAIAAEPNAPIAPTGLTVTEIVYSPPSLKLEWNASENAASYAIYRKLNEEAVFASMASTSEPSFTDSSIQLGKTYNYQVKAVSEDGEESEPSSTLTVHVEKNSTEAPASNHTYKFDWGTPSGPVAEGHIQVSERTLYTVQLGYGFLTAPDSRMRSAPADDPLRIDFILLGNHEFVVDVPYGKYKVKVIAGDGTNSQSTVGAIQGQSFGELKTNSGQFKEHEAVVEVTDGKIRLTFEKGRVVAVYVSPMVSKPKGLTSVVDMASGIPSVKLEWNEGVGASSYKVYRRLQNAADFALIGNTEAAALTDHDVMLAMTYEYQVRAVSLEGDESEPSEIWTVVVVDPAVNKPAAPTGLSVIETTENSVRLSWQAVTGALSYYIYRSDAENKSYAYIGRTTGTQYTDMNVSTHKPLYYKVAAVNEGGLSTYAGPVASTVAKVILRQSELLNRGVVAMKTDEGVFVSWRLLGHEAKTTGFNLYRDGVKVNAAPLFGGTNYPDPAGKVDSLYSVAAVIQGIEQPKSEPVTVWGASYLDVPLDKPAGGVNPDNTAYTYSANDASLGDLDGDGEYEIVVKWDPSNSRDNSQDGITGEVFVDAYKLDGTKLWRISLGRNIRAGAHYTQFLVYDFDGDGKAEVVFKTADGTVDGTGVVIGDANADYRQQDSSQRIGRVLAGPEYLTVFDGLTGRALTTVDYDPPRGNVRDWGDDYGNRVDRFLATVAYLDGERPSIVMARGYYTRTVLAAYNWRDGQLTKVWTFDTDTPGNEMFAGQGNHGLNVADVDADGKDEIVYGGMTVDHDGTGLYSTGVGHGDALHVSDFYPDRPGLEVFKVQEHYPNPAGVAMWDAETGEFIWKIPADYDVGRGAIADIDPRYPGAEAWAVGSSNWNDTAGGIYTQTGERISVNIPAANFVIWWDGDLLREILDHSWNNAGSYGVGVINKWDYEKLQSINLLTAEGTRSNNSTKGNPSLQADFLGDWREEAVWRTEDSSALRIYSTTIPTEHRIQTLMHDPVYRLGIATQNVGYNQPPHTSYYLGQGMEEAPQPSIYSTVPVGLKAMINDGIQLSWLPVRGAAEYHLYRSDAGQESFTKIGSTPGTSYLDGAVESGKLYDYKVTAVQEGNETPASTLLRVSTVAQSAHIGSPGQVNANQQFEVQLKLSGAEGISGIDVQLSYDVNQFEFVKFVGANDKVDQLLTEDAYGQARIIIAALGADAALFNEADVGSIVFRAKAAGTGAIAIDRIQLGDKEGRELELTPPAQVSVTVVASNSSSLAETLQLARSLYEAAVEGFTVGQYPPGTKDAILDAAIVEAQVALAAPNATPERLNAADAELKEALNRFERLKISAETGELNDRVGLSIGDLSVAASYYGLDSSAADWQLAGKADMNDDGRINIYDLAFISKLILANP